MISYRVRLYWLGINGGGWESSCDGAFPEGTTPIQAIVEVAEWRSVNLDCCTRIEVERIDP